MGAQTLTIEQGYRAMYYFFEHEYEVTNSEELVCMLGPLSWEIWTDGFPVDPAAWEDWKDAVKKTLAIHWDIASEEKVMHEQRLTAEQAYQSMYHFLEHEYELVNADEIAAMLNAWTWEAREDNNFVDPAIWKNWQNAVEKALSFQKVGPVWVRWY